MKESQGPNLMVKKHYCTTKRDQGSRLPGSIPCSFQSLRVVIAYRIPHPQRLGTGLLLGSGIEK